jgi:hypothetical protein
MSRLLAEAMVGERMVTDAFTPKARVIAEPLACNTSCLCGELFLCSLAFEEQAWPAKSRAG